MNIDKIDLEKIPKITGGNFDPFEIGGTSEVGGGDVLGGEFSTAEDPPAYSGMVNYPVFGK